MMYLLSRPRIIQGLALALTFVFYTILPDTHQSNLPSKLYDLQPLTRRSTCDKMLAKRSAELTEEVFEKPFEKLSAERGMAKGSWGDMRVAIVDFTEYHEEVWGAVVASFHHLGANVTQFRTAFRFHFGDIAENLVDPGTPKPLDPELIIEYLDRGDIDLMVVVSGDEYWFPERFREAAIRSSASVALILHQCNSLRPERQTLLPLAKDGRLTFLGLADHTTRLIRQTISVWAAEDSEVGWDQTDVETFIPIFPVQSKPEVKAVGEERFKPSIISRAAIQGNIEYWRRDYKRIFAELFDAITAEPDLWGYQSTPAGEPFLKATGKHALPPFTLHLIGHHGGEVTWPKELDSVIHVHHSLQYTQYYDLLGSMDVVLPAFAGPEYFLEKASSSVPAGIIARVPILVTPLHLRAYSYLDEPAFILHPVGMSAVSALHSLRQDKSPWSTSFAPVKAGQMLLSTSQSQAKRSEYKLPKAKGQYGREVQWERYLEQLYISNDQIWTHIYARIKANVDSKLPKKAHPQEIEMARK